jgi:hypothetical protein
VDCSKQGTFVGGQAWEAWLLGMHWCHDNGDVKIVVCGCGVLVCSNFNGM